LIVGLQQIVSRRIPAGIPSVLSFGKFEALGSTNVIPPKVNLAGTFRIMNEEWRQIALLEIQKMAEGIVSSMGGSLECRIVPGYPALRNDPDLTESISTSAAIFAHPDNITTLPLRMTGEDFSRYGQKFPASFYRLGTGGPDFDHPVHHPNFDIDESALTHGMGMMAWLALTAHL
jgi:metal-dependent amidase/aminoacylase/carboxypeptidase family protein